MDGGAKQLPLVIQCLIGGPILMLILGAIGFVLSAIGTIIKNTIGLLDD